MTRNSGQWKAGLVAAALAGAAGASGALAASSLTGADERRLWEAERTWVRALETSDVALLEGLVDDTLSFIGPDGQYEDRAAYLAGYRALPAMGVKVQKVELSEVKMRVLDDTGIVTGKVLARVQVQGQTLVEDVRFTRVYRRRGDRFRMVAGQGTRLAPPPPAASAAGHQGSREPSP